VEYAVEIDKARHCHPEAADDEPRLVRLVPDSSHGLTGLFNDDLAWHEMPRLGPGAMRRRRLIDVVPGAPIQVFAMFRDTHLDAEGVEAVLHEYSLTAELDSSGKAIAKCAALPRVLPWPECPLAADSARRLNGVQLEEVKAVVGRDLRGTSTCTHLNDLLRSLGRVASLLPHLS